MSGFDGRVLVVIVRNGSRGGSHGDWDGFGVVVMVHLVRTACG